MGRALGLVALAGFAVLAAGGVGRVVAEPPAAATVAAPVSQPAAPVSQPAALNATLASLLGRVDAVSHEVAHVRGLPLKHPIPYDVVDRDELRRRLLAEAAKDKSAAETAAEGFAFERWGLIPPGIDYQAMLIDLLTEQIAGYYDSDTKKLTLSESAGDNPDWAEMVLAHELDHGIQDQSFDLHTFEDLPDAESDAGMARHALVEGDGIAVMLEVVVGRRVKHFNWSAPEIAAAFTKDMSATGGGDKDSEKIDRAPLAIRESMIFPYRAGFSFVAAVYRHHSWKAIDAVFARPPKSTAQILHPERYLAGDEPVAVALAAPAALPGFAIEHTSVWGELGFGLWLRSHGVDQAAAEQAAAGWSGDRAIVLARPSDHRAAQAVGIARSEWVSEADAIEAAEAAGKALADSVVGATIERSPTRMRLFGVDGKISWLERRASSLVIVVGAPAWAADALATELWKPAKSNAAAR
jgi:hypothetical protein